LALFFWALGLTVLYQFITRYVFDDSAAWTEEIARYLLVATVFVGAVIGLAKNNHIQVDFFFRFMSRGLARTVSLLTDVLRVAFYGLHRLADLVARCKKWAATKWGHCQPAHEYRLRRGVIGLCFDDMARTVGHVDATGKKALACLNALTSSKPFEGSNVKNHFFVFVERRLARGHGHGCGIV
jgi:hypothetical protein